jgi:alkylation response protein AidB-like acyl-CoA dehydrogenase
MYLAPEGDEIAISDAAADFLAGAMPIERLHSAGSADLGAQLRGQLGQMGWFALAVCEADGGSGLSAVEHALFFREAGRQCAPIDLLAQCLAANAIAYPALRSSVIAGEVGVALAIADHEGLRIIGRTDAAYAIQVEPAEVRIYDLAKLFPEERPALDPANSMRILAALPVPIETATGANVWNLGQLGTSAMLVGLAEAALDLTVEYAKIRETFGRKIGAYQAVRHPCADMAVRAEAARCELYYAAAALKEMRSDAGVHLDAAKYLANTAAHANTDTCIQLHGGIGVTDEHNAHLLMKHSLLLSRLFGSKRHVLSRLLDARLEL